MNRDWVVKAFNDDLPYNQFVRAQLAGVKKDSALAKQKVQLRITSAQIWLKRKRNLFYRNSAKAHCKIAVFRQLKQTAIYKDKDGNRNN